LLELRPTMAVFYAALNVLAVLVRPVVLHLLSAWLDLGIR